jgi:protein O-GlcNAc transferase
MSKAANTPSKGNKTRIPKEPAQAEKDAIIHAFNSGQYAEAEQLALALTRTYQYDAFGWKVLGAARKQMGRTADALAPQQKSAQLRPADAELHSNLGVTLRGLGRLDEAEASYQRAIALKPDYAEAHSNLGNVLKDLGRLDDAEASYRQAIALRPDYAVAHNSLGNTLKDLGRLDEAEASYRQAIALRPDYAVAHNNLGNTLKDLGRLDEAEASYRQAVVLKPDFVEAHSNLGVVLQEFGRLDEAEARCRQAIVINPEFAEAYYNLGNTLKDLGRLGEAESSYRQAIAINPDLTEAHSNLGNTLKDLGRLNESIASYRQAIALKPDYALAHNNLGTALKELGRLDEVEASFRQAIALKPDYAEAYSNLLFTLNYIASRDSVVRLEEARNYGLLVSAQVKERFTTWHCCTKPSRLRVGLISGDLVNHPVGYFLESMLEQLNPASIELRAYPTINRSDDLTDRIRPRFHSWKPLVGLSDEAAARLIHSDGVHILLDLAGHTAHNRLPLFAWKPAPVQATWLGYLATTGVAEMDYLIGDPQATPPENCEYFSETVWRLPEVWGCFTPPNIDLEVSPLPALSNGFLTFGCFNNLTKMNDTVVALWARVLQAVPGSRLFLKTKQLEDQTVCETTRQRFRAHGIEPESLILEGASPRLRLLEAYNRVDIALDPFPYGGGTTTYEVLWMAVPIITLKGDRFLSRCGQSLAYNAGLADWIAEDDDDYVAKAVMHTQDLKQLSALRTGLRQQVLASPLFDAPRFARHLEAALWGMWERWQGGRNGQKWPK